MGEAAESMLEGECCQECGEWFHDGEAPGHPRSCAGCGGAATGGGRTDGKRRREKARKKRRAAERLQRLKKTPADGWKKHTQFHWSREFKGKKLDYWPSTGRFYYDGAMFEGDPAQFMKDSA